MKKAYGSGAGGGGCAGVRLRAAGLPPFPVLSGVKTLDVSALISPHLFFHRIEFLKPSFFFFFFKCLLLVGIDPDNGDTIVMQTKPFPLQGLNCKGT